jgi:hypothetical protein
MTPVDILTLTNFPPKICCSFFLGVHSGRRKLFDSMGPNFGIRALLCFNALAFFFIIIIFGYGAQFRSCI